MLKITVLAGVLMAGTAFAPASAEPRGRDGDRVEQSERGAKWSKHKRAAYEKRKRWRYAQRRYAYPWTPWWGPFAGPPGL
jgi:hypothetical protein